MTPIRSTGDDTHDRVEDATCYVLGGEHVGTAVARRLRTDDHDVCVVDESCDPSELVGFQGDPTDVRALETAGVSGASTVVVATPSDSRNLLVAQLVRVHFDVPDVVVLANVPDRLGLLAAAGHEPVCATSALSDALVDRV